MFYFANKNKEACNGGLANADTIHTVVPWTEPRPEQGEGSTLNAWDCLMSALLPLAATSLGPYTLGQAPLDLSSPCLRWGSAQGKDQTGVAGLGSFFLCCTNYFVLYCNNFWHNTILSDIFVRKPCWTSATAVGCAMVKFVSPGLRAPQVQVPELTAASTR